MKPITRLISKEKVSEASSGELDGVRFPTSQSVGNLSTRKKNKVKSMQIGNIHIELEQKMEEFDNLYKVSFTLILGNWVAMEEEHYLYGEQVAEMLWNCEWNDLEALYKLPTIKKMVLIENAFYGWDFVEKTFSESIPVEEKCLYLGRDVPESYKFSFRDIVFFGYWEDLEVPFHRIADYKLITYELIRVALEVWNENRSY